MADAPFVRSIEKTRARVDSLRVHPRNPRTISPARMEQLQRTLEAEPDMLGNYPFEGEGRWPSAASGRDDLC